MRRKQLIILILVVSSAAWAQKTTPGKSAASAGKPVSLAESKAAAPPVLVLHNRMGMRIEFDAAHGLLDIWVTPSLSQSLDAQNSNFSNRDEHTRLFDQIAFPKLIAQEFLRYEYDPFQTVLYYKNQTLHIFNPVHHSALLLWCDKPEIMTIKGDRSDRVLTRSDKVFSLEHGEAGQTFQFTAELGEGNGKISYSPWSAAGRSPYARVQTAAGQMVILTTGPNSEETTSTAHHLAGTSIGDLFTAQDRAVLQATQKGTIEVRDRAGLQKMLDANRLLLLSMQDASGGLHQSMARDGYVLAQREGTLAAVFSAYSGWLDPLTQWSALQLTNPTRLQNNPSPAVYFGEVVDKAINGRREDGLFFAVWSAFTHWSQSGSRRVVDEQRLALLEEAMSGLEQYCFDAKQNAFGRYHIGSLPLVGSADFGWDGASGKPVDQAPLSWQGKEIARSYDLYINQLAYSCYLMLAAMETGARADAFANKADKMEKYLESYYKKSDALPSFGTLYGEKGKLGQSEPFSLSADDYMMALSLPPFYSDYAAIHGIRQVALRDLTARKKQLSWAGYWSFISGLDPLFQNEEDIVKAIDDGVAAASATQQAPYFSESVIENESNGVSGFAACSAPIGSLYAALANTGLRRTPFGLAFRPSRILNRLSQYEYKGRLLDVQFRGSGSIASVSINGQTLSRTWQLPEAFLQDGVNEVQVNLGTEPAATGTLVYSTVRLENVKTTGAETVFEMDGFGKNVVVFKNLSGQLKIRAADGTTIPFLTNKKNGFTYIECFNRGKMAMSVR